MASWPRSVLLALGVVGLLVCLARAGKLVGLDDDNLEGMFTKHLERDWIILFSNKKATSPELEKTFRDFAGEEDAFMLATVECTSDPDLCLDYQISKRSGPVIMLYTGEEQTSEAWKAWAHRTRHGSVYVLTHNNWNASVSNGQWFVKYYAPWCNHCSQMAPMWKEFSEEHKNHFKVAKFDCTVPEHQTICEEENVKGYPAFVFYIDGERFLHSGERTKEIFLRTVKRARRGLHEHDGSEDDEVQASFVPPEESSPYEEIQV